MNGNLIPPDLRPTNVNSTPYALVAGLVVLCGLWLARQVSEASRARRAEHRAEAHCTQLAADLQRANQLGHQLAEAEKEKQALESKAAFVTALTEKPSLSAALLHGVADALPDTLRLTEAVLDPGQPPARLAGYGPTRGTERAVAEFLGSLRRSAVIGEVFASASLDLTPGSAAPAQGASPFAVVLRYRRAAEPEPTPED
jgi:Tfp pilus assembly protein PilN